MLESITLYYRLKPIIWTLCRKARTSRTACKQKSSLEVKCHQTGKTTAISRITVRETGVSRHQPNWRPLPLFNGLVNLMSSGLQKCASFHILYNSLGFRDISCRKGHGWVIFGQLSHWFCIDYHECVDLHPIQDGSNHTVNIERDIHTRSIYDIMNISVCHFLLPYFSITTHSNIIICFFFYYT